MSKKPTEESGAGNEKNFYFKVEDLINLSFGPTNKNLIHCKLIQTVLLILARHMRILEQKVEFRDKDGTTEVLFDKLSPVSSTEDKSGKVHKYKLPKLPTQLTTKAGEVIRELYEKTLLPDPGAPGSDKAISESTRIRDETRTVEPAVFANKRHAKRRTKSADEFGRGKRSSWGQTDSVPHHRRPHDDDNKPKIKGIDEEYAMDENIIKEEDVTEQSETSVLEEIEQGEDDHKRPAKHTMDQIQEESYEGREPKKSADSKRSPGKWDTDSKDKSRGRKYDDEYDDQLDSGKEKSKKPDADSKRSLEKRDTDSSHKDRSRGRKYDDDNDDQYDTRKAKSGPGKKDTDSKDKSRGRKYDDEYDDQYDTRKAKSGTGTKDTESKDKSRGRNDDVEYDDRYDAGKIKSKKLDQKLSVPDRAHSARSIPAEKSSRSITRPLSERFGRGTSFTSRHDQDRRWKEKPHKGEEEDVLSKEQNIPVPILEKKEGSKKRKSTVKDIFDLGKLYIPKERDVETVSPKLETTKWVEERDRDKFLIEGVKFRMRPDQLKQLQNELLRRGLRLNARNFEDIMKSIQKKEMRTKERDKTKKITPRGRRTRSQEPVQDKGGKKGLKKRAESADHKPKRRKEDWKEDDEKDKHFKGKAGRDDQSGRGAGRKRDRDEETSGSSSDLDRKRGRKGKPIETKRKHGVESDDEISRGHEGKEKSREDDEKRKRTQSARDKKKLGSSSSESDWSGEYGKGKKHRKDDKGGRRQSSEDEFDERGRKHDKKRAKSANEGTRRIDSDMSDFGRKDRGRSLDDYGRGQRGKDKKKRDDDYGRKKGDSEDFSDEYQKKGKTKSGEYDRGKGRREDDGKEGRDRRSRSEGRGREPSDEKHRRRGSSEDILGGGRRGREGEESDEYGERGGKGKGREVSDRAKDARGRDGEDDKYGERGGHGKSRGDRDGRGRGGAEDDEYGEGGYRGKGREDRDGRSRDDEDDEYGEGGRRGKGKGYRDKDGRGRGGVEDDEYGEGGRRGKGKGDRDKDGRGKDGEEDDEYGEGGRRGKGRGDRDKDGRGRGSQDDEYDEGGRRGKGRADRDGRGRGGEEDEFGEGGRKGKGRGDREKDGRGRGGEEDDEYGEGGRRGKGKGDREGRGRDGEEGDEYGKRGRRGKGREDEEFGEEGHKDRGVSDRGRGRDGEEDEYGEAGHMGRGKGKVEKDGTGRGGKEDDEYGEAGRRGKGKGDKDGRGRGGEEDDEYGEDGRRGKGKGERDGRGRDGEDDEFGDGKRRGTGRADRDGSGRGGESDEFGEEGRKGRGEYDKGGRGGKGWDDKDGRGRGGEDDEFGEGGRKGKGRRVREKDGRGRGGDEDDEYGEEGRSGKGRDRDRDGRGRDGEEDDEYSEGGRKGKGAKGRRGDKDDEYGGPENRGVSDRDKGGRGGEGKDGRGKGGEEGDDLGEGVKGRKGRRGEEDEYGEGERRKGKGGRGMGGEDDEYGEGGRKDRGRRGKGGEDDEFGEGGRKGKGGRGKGGEDDDYGEGGRKDKSGRGKGGEDDEFGEKGRKGKGGRGKGSEDDEYGEGGRKDADGAGRGGKAGEGGHKGKGRDDEDGRGRGRDGEDDKFGEKLRKGKGRGGEDDEFRKSRDDTGKERGKKGEADDRIGRRGSDLSVGDKDKRGKGRRGSEDDTGRRADRLGKGKGRLSDTDVWGKGPARKPSLTVEEEKQGKEKVIVVKKRPSRTDSRGGPLRVGSIECVTQEEFQELEERVRKLQEKAGPLPLPKLPDNKKLRSDIARGSATLTDTMKAMQLSARVDAAEKAVDRLADMMTQLAAQGSLPPELAEAANIIKAQLAGLLPKDKDALSLIGKGATQRYGPDQGKMGKGRRDEKSNLFADDQSDVISRVSQASAATGTSHGIAVLHPPTTPYGAMKTPGMAGGKWAGGIGSGVQTDPSGISSYTKGGTVLSSRMTSASKRSSRDTLAVPATDFDGALRVVREELINTLEENIGRTNNIAQTAIHLAKTITHKLDVAVALDDRINTLNLVVEDYTQQLDGFDRGLTTQMMSFNQQINQMREDMNAGLEQMQAAQNKSETEAVLELTSRYEALVFELEGTVHDHLLLVSVQDGLSQDLKSLINAVENMREQKADRDEVLDALKDKADVTRLKGLLTDEDFNAARQAIDAKLMVCHEKFSKQDKAWMNALSELSEIIKEKAQLIHLQALRDEEQKELQDLLEKIQILTKVLGEPKAAVLTRKISLDGRCAACRIPALMDALAPVHVHIPNLPALRPPPVGEEEHICLQEIPKVDSKTHVCQRWVGGSHTVLNEHINREQAMAVDPGPAVKKYLSEGSDGKVYRLEIPVQPCEECNPEPKIPGETESSPKTGGGGDQVNVINIADARRVTVIDEDNIRSAQVVEAKFKEPGSRKASTPNSEQPLKQYINQKVTMGARSSIASRKSIALGQDLTVLNPASLKFFAGALQPEEAHRKLSDVGAIIKGQSTGISEDEAMNVAIRKECEKLAEAGRIRREYTGDY